VGWENLPRRLLQLGRVRSGLLRRQLDPETFSDQAYRASLRPDRSEQALWRQRRDLLLPARPGPALSTVCDEARWREQVTAVCERALSGEYPFFSRWTGELGWPPRFNFDPVHQLEWPVGEHWLSVLGRGARQDVKLVWEPSRFSLAFYLARAYARHPDERWAEAFWQMLESFVEQNPAELSIAWGCGQEITFRLMAMLFAASVLQESPSTSPHRLALLSRLAWQSGRHIRININQALMQGNNHGVSESVGLWTIGLLFPELRAAESWRAQGERCLAHEVERLVAADGSFAQHSVSYHRVLLDDLIWALRLTEVSGQTLPQVVRDRFESATNWLAEMIDLPSGRCPNYGGNDGANVLPLSACDYLDYRPTLHAAWFLLHRERCFEEGPWDEKLLWLFGPRALSAPLSKLGRSSIFAARQGGYYFLRGRQSWLMTRCHTYRHRPGQCDGLHVDLWYQGVNVLRDAGSYLYHHDDRRWQHYFRSTAGHNTVEINGKDQMTKGPQFLWFDWTRTGERPVLSTDQDGAFFSGEIIDFAGQRGLTHRREITRQGDCYLIRDLVDGHAARRARLRWRLCPAEWHGSGAEWRARIGRDEIQLRLRLPEGASVRLACGEEGEELEGWESLYYGERSQVPVIVVDMPAPAEAVTIIGLTQEISLMARRLGAGPLPASDLRFPA
jgi:hypothetical protein